MRRCSSMSATAGPSTTTAISRQSGSSRAAHVGQRQVHAAGEGDSAVDHDELPVVPQVRSSAKRDVKHRHEESNLRAGLDQRRKKPSAEAARSPGRRSGAGRRRPRAARRVSRSTIARLPSSQPRIYVVMWIVDRASSIIRRIRWYASTPDRSRARCGCRHGPAGRRTRPADVRCPLRWNSPDRRTIGW